MAEFIAADLIARLRADISQFEQALNTVRQRLAELSQRLQGTVQVQVQNQQATNQLAQAMQLQARAIQQQTQALTQAQQAAQAFRQQQDQLRESLQRSGSAWQTMLTVAGGVGLATGLGALVSQMTQFARSVVDAGVRVEQLHATLSAISGSTQEGAAQFQNLVIVAQRLGFGLTQLAEGFRIIAGATRGTVLAGVETQKIFEAVATASRAMGASQQQVARALLAIGQVISKGTVQMEELRGQLAEAIPGAVQIAARALGVTTEQLNKMVEAGEVRAIPFIRALTRQMTEELAPAAQQAPATAGAAFARLGNEILLAKNALAEAFMPALVAAANATSRFLGIFREYREAQALLQEGERGVQILGTGLRQRDIPPEAQADLDRIRRQRAEAEARLKAAQQEGIAGILGRAALPPGTQELLGTLQQEEQALLANLRVQREQRQEQERQTAEARRLRAARANEADVLENIRTKLKDIATQQEQLRRRAAAAPEVQGSLQGTPEQVETFRKRQQEILKKEVGTLAGMVAQLPPGSAAQSSEEVQRVRALSREYGVLEKAITDASAAQSAGRRASRDATQEAERAARQAAQDQEAYQRSIDNVRMALVRQEEQALQTLENVRSRFFQSREELALDVVTGIQERFPHNEVIQAQAAQVRASLETRDAYLEEVEALKERFNVLKLNADAMRQHEQAQEQFREQLAGTLEQLAAPAEERRELQLRRRAARSGVDLTAQDEAMLRQISAQERLNTIMATAQRIGDSAAQTITNGLMNIVSATENVRQAWRAMAKSILDATAQIVLNEGFRTLIRLGLGLVAGAVGSSATGALAGNTTLNSPTYINTLVGGVRAGAQGIGPINSPTMILAGENPLTTPEYLLNSSQMQSLLGAGPSAGGQAAGGNLTIINVASQAQAEQTAAQRRAMGDQVIINAVLSEMSKGSGSRIVQMAHQAR